MQSAGQAFQSLREASGFKSQRELAIRSGISNGTIARVESGTQKPTPDTLMALSTHLHATNYQELMDIFGYGGSPNSESSIRCQWFASLVQTKILETLLLIEDGIFSMEDIEENLRLLLREANDFYRSNKPA